MAAVPVIWGAVGATGPFLIAAWAPVPITNKLKGSVATFVNTLSAGFGLGNPITDAAVMEGTGTVLPAGATVQSVIGSTAWLSTTTVGVGLVVYDAVVGMLYRVAHKSAPRTRIMGKQLISG